MAVGEVFDILAVFVPDEVVEVQGGKFGRAARVCRAVAGGAAAQRGQGERVTERPGAGRDPDGRGHGQDWV